MGTGFAGLAKRFVVERTPWAIGLRPGALPRGMSLVTHGDKLVVRDGSGRQIWLGRDNAVYVPDMANFFDYYFGAVEPFRLPAMLGGDLVVDFSSPRFHVVRGFDDFPVFCPSLVEPYATCGQYLDFADLSEEHVVLDLGAYSGLTSIAFSKAVGKSGSVLAFEPDPRNREACVRNLGMHGRLSGLGVGLHPFAISGRSGRLRFSSEGAMGSSAVDNVGDYRGTVVEVECRSLSDVAAENGLSRVDFVKMDIEGSEMDALSSSREFLERFRPRLIIESHVVNGRLNAGDLVSLLEGFGYQCSVIEQHGVSLPLVTALP